MAMIETSHNSGPQLAPIPRRDPGLIAIPVLGLASVVVVQIRPSLVALPLAVAAVLATLPFASALEARSVTVPPVLLSALNCAVALLAVGRPALYLIAIPAALFTISIWAMPRLSRGGVSDSVFAGFLGFALFGILPSHLGLMAVTPFAGGDSMGKALVAVTVLVTAANLAAAAAADRSLKSRSVGGPVVGGQIGADVAGLLAGVLVSLIASTIKRPSGSILDYLLFAVAITIAVAIGRRLASVFVTGGSDPHEIVSPSLIGDTYSLQQMLPASLAFSSAYYLGRLVFV